MFTGDPGHPGDLEYTYNGYYIAQDGTSPDEYRAGCLWVGTGDLVRVGVNSEKVRDLFQNKLIHENYNIPQFSVLDRPTKAYVQFGSGTGNTLW